MGMKQALRGPWAGLEGRKLFAAWLDTIKREEPSRDQTWVAKLVGVTQPTISQWKSGMKRPEPHQRKILWEVAGIPESAWLSPEEQEAIRLACERFAPLATTGTEG
jgi:hypothetical protein